jgi:putative acetyltransferase
MIPGFRGTGVAEEILRALEMVGHSKGNRRSILETGIKQPEAIRFYEKNGYTRIPNYGDYAGKPMSVCMGKDLC